MKNLFEQKQMSTIKNKKKIQIDNVSKRTKTLYIN